MPDQALSLAADLTVPITLTVDGEIRRLSIVPWATLFDALRLTLAPNGCDDGRCGACTAVLDGATVTTCLVLAVMVDGAAISLSRDARCGGAFGPG